MLKQYSSESLEKRPLRVLVYGETGVGKTTLGCTFPKPVFLMTGREQDQTLRDYKVDVLELTSDEDMGEAISLIRKNEAGWKSVIIDSITYHTDAIMQKISGSSGKVGLANKNPMQLKDWGILESYLTQSLLPALHSLPLHVVWIASVKQTMRRASDGTSHLAKLEPAIAGGARDRIPNKCDVVALMTRVKTFVDSRAVLSPRMFLKQPAGLDYEIVARSCDGLPGTKRPDDIEPTFTALCERFDWVDTSGVNGATTKITVKGTVTEATPV